MEVLGSTNDDKGAAVDICGSNATFYKRVDIWIRIDQIQDVYHLLPEYDPAHAAELKASFLHFGVQYNCSLILSLL